MTENQDGELEFIEPEPRERRGRPKAWWFAAAGVVVALAVVVIVVVARSGDEDGDDVADLAGDDASETVSGADDDQGDATPAPQTDESERSGTSDGDGGIAFGGDAALSIARGGGGNDWLVPWGDGFLSFGYVYAGQPLPELDGTYEELFPAEVVELIRSSGVTTIDEATELLVEAGLYETVAEIVTANPELQEQIFSIPAPPPTFEVRRSADGLDWQLAEGVEFPIAEIHSVISDGVHLVVAGVVGADYESGDPGTMQVAITTDLTNWEIHELSGPDTGGLPDVVHAESWVGSAAIGPDGWLVASSSSFWLDEWVLLSPHVSELQGGWNVQADESGLTIEVYELYDEVYLEDVEAARGSAGGDGDTADAGGTDPAPDVAASTVADPDDDCCEVIDTIELTWEEVGIDYATWMQYREGENETISTWTAPWGAPPVQTVVGGGIGVGSVVGTDAGFVATGWHQQSGESRMLFSTDGREWVERQAPLSGEKTWIEQVLRVEGGVVVTGGSESTRTTWRGDSDATNWQVVDLPAAAADRWWGAWSFSSLPGVAAVVDLTEYPLYEYDEESYETPAGSDADDPATDPVAVETDTGQASAVPVPTPDGDFEYPDPDFWLLTTRDGFDWQLQDLDDPAPEQSYPQNALINGDVVLVRLGETWLRYELS